MQKTRSLNIGCIALWNGAAGRRFDFKSLLTSLLKREESPSLKKRDLGRFFIISFLILDSAEPTDPALYPLIDPAQKYLF